MAAVLEIQCGSDVVTLTPDAHPVYDPRRLFRYPAQPGGGFILCAVRNEANRANRERFASLSTVRRIVPVRRAVRES